MKIFSLLIILVICKITFSQSNMVFESQLTSQNQTITLNETPYSGFVISFFENDQPKSIYEVRNGIKDGKVTEYVKDKYFIKGSFKDTILINRLNKEIVLKKKELELLIQDTLKASKEVKDFLNYEIGGVDKLVKLKEKNDEGKLNQKKKEEFDKYEGLVQSREQRIRKLNNSQNELQSINQILKTESSKNEYIPTKSKEYTIVNSTKEGAAIIYDSIGNKFGEGNYKNGKQDGQWVYYYPGGRKQGEGNYIEGDEGNIGSSGIPKNGMEGSWILYYKNGIIQEEFFCKEGKFNGLHKVFHENGKLNYQGNVSNDKDFGVFTFYDENGNKIQESNYVDGKKNGLEILYHKNGLKEEEYDLKNDLKNGLNKRYFESGKLQYEASFRLGNLNGSTKEYYENGNLKYEITFKNNKTHGIAKHYYESGKLKISANYDTTSLQKDQLLGDLFEYNDDGTTKFHGYVNKDGSVIDKTESNSNKSETNGSYSKTEMNKPYKCKCCKATINGLEEGVDNKGNDFSQWMFDFNAKAYYSLESSFKAFGFKDVYDYMRKQEYPFCSLKCFRACQE